MTTTRNQYIIPNILPATEALLLNDVYLVVLYATRIPPHLAISVNGKLFTLTVKGATVDGELKALLKLIRQRNIDSIFIKLSVPAVFTLDQLRDEIKKYTLAYPRVDVGIATCLSPIKDFCSEVYEAEMQRVNYVFDLLPKLYERNVIASCYQLNLDRYLVGNSFYLSKYNMNDIYEGIRSASYTAV
ncbi:MAG: hypothetical protein JNL63_08630 [Bacteroidia bacterium]|nr:hypothetical protein [Bacteroidia bacterium]